ncbi:thymidine kinase [Spiroplasma endosymbiont of Crioceris asparagi]|uniref:thymidine kinase n=1 Tax=Spiroplasma endosymbiont of Crioceris asparagi TaxID=3066286 RepID=UPI003BAE6249
MPILNYKTGWIELIVGCMFAGKTEEFIRRLLRYKYGKKNIVVFKPEIDKRYSVTKVQTHHGVSIDAVPVKDTEELLKALNEIEKTKKVDVIGIDELQFFDTKIVDVVSQLADNGYIIVANGLDKDFMSNPFKNVYELLPQAEYVEKLSAICFVCGGLANKTQRIDIKKGEEASPDSPIILISGANEYQARCRHCYVKPK